MCEYLQFCLPFCNGQLYNTLQHTLLKHAAAIPLRNKYPGTTTICTAWRTFPFELQHFHVMPTKSRLQVICKHSCTNPAGLCTKFGCRALRVYSITRSRIQFIKVSVDASSIHINRSLREYIVVLYRLKDHILCKTWEKTEQWAMHKQSYSGDLCFKDTLSCATGFLQQGHQTGFTQG